ncbi:MAG: AzlC family ABC transporter permease [Clostridia bacterium]|nr:AzlC family ABC transporter permease [Clostridia bacterium]
MSNCFSNLKFKNGVKDGLPIGLGYFPVAFAFGVQASILGVPILISLLISMTNLTSAGQLAGLTIVATMGSFIEIIATQLVINSRYFLMSTMLSQKTDDSFTFKHRLLTSTFITDEIFAIAVSKPNNISKNYFYGLALLPYIGWALGTLFGATAGNLLPQSVVYALGIALYAMFIAIIIPPSTKNLGVLFAVLLSAGISCLFYYLPILKSVSSGFAIIISAILSAGVIAYFFPVKKEERDNA